MKSTRRHTFKALCLILILTAALQTSAQENITLTSHADTRRFSADTAHIASLFRTSGKLLQTNIDSAILLCKMALSYSIAINYNDGAAWALLRLAAANYTYKLDVEASKRYWKQAYYFCRHASFQKGELLALYYMDMAAPHDVAGRYDSVAWYCHQALDAVQTYNVQGNRLRVILYNNLATVYDYMQQYDKALYYLQQADALLQTRLSDEPLISIYANYGSVYAKKKDYVRALIYCKEALAISNRFPQSKEIRARSFIYYTLGNIYLDKGVPAEALRYFRRAVHAENTVPTFTGNATHYAGIASAYGMLNDLGQQEHYLLKAIDEAHTKHVGGLTIVNMYNELASMYNRSERYDKAYHYRDLALAIKDTLFNKEKLELTNKMEVIYRASEKNNMLIAKQLQLSHRANELKEKDAWVIAVSGISLTLLIALAGMHHSNRQKQRLQIEKMSILQKEKEINSLKAVIKGEERERSRLARELHDGIMVLFSAIKMKLRGLHRQHEGLYGDAEFTNIKDQLDHAIKELRRTAHNLMPDMLLEGGLAEAVFYFCQSLQQNTNLNIVFQHYGEMPRLQEEYELSLYRIVQELIQNIIKHAHASKAIIQLNYRDGLLDIAVEDNGKGFLQHSSNPTTGRGLKSIKTRVNALNGIVEIKPAQPSGTNAYLEFDIRSVIRA